MIDRLAPRGEPVDAAVSPVGAWQGWWDDAVTGFPTSGRGYEIWRSRQLARWEAALDSVADGQDPAAALGIL